MGHLQIPAKSIRQLHLPRRLALHIKQRRRLKIRLETVKELPGPLTPIEQLHQTFFAGLCRVNQDFREVTKMFDRSCLEIEIYGFEDGPFSERDIRVKNKYVAQ